MKNLLLKQLDKCFSQLRPLRSGLNVPPGGWVRTMRKALGMTTIQLARRLGFDRSRVVKIETSELEGAVTVATLQNVAAALNCEFIYGFFPKNKLEVIIKAQAERIANDLIERIVHSMALEAQNLTVAQKKEQQKVLVHKLLSGPLKYLWANDTCDLPKKIRDTT